MIKILLINVLAPAYTLATFTLKYHNRAPLLKNPTQQGYLTCLNIAIGSYSDVV
jgi:hypothetical protein